MARDVVILKLVTGDEIVCRMDVTFEKGDDIYLDMPLQIQTVQEGGKVGFGMMPWIMAAEDQGFTISENAIITMGTPKHGLESQYLSAVTGLAL